MYGRPAARQFLRQVRDQVVLEPRDVPLGLVRGFGIGAQLARRGAALVNVLSAHNHRVFEVETAVAALGLMRGQREHCDGDQPTAEQRRDAHDPALPATPNPGPVSLLIMLGREDQHRRHSSQLAKFRRRTRAAVCVGCGPLATTTAKPLLRAGPGPVDRRRRGHRPTDRELNLGVLAQRDLGQIAAPAPAVDGRGHGPSRGSDPARC